MVLRFRLRGGQSTVEYMLYLSVLVIAMVATAYVLIGPLEQGMDGLSRDAVDVFDNGQQVGTNDMR